MTVEHNIHAEEQDDRCQESCTLLENRIEVRFIDDVPVLGKRSLFHLSAPVPVPPEENHDCAACDKQHSRFAERIKGAVIQNHAGDNIDSSGFLQAIFNVPSGDVVHDRRVRRSEYRHFHDGMKKTQNDANADQDRENAVQNLGMMQATGHGAFMERLIDRFFFLMILLHFFLKDVLCARNIFRRDSRGFSHFGYHGPVQRICTVAKPVSGAFLP